MNKEFEWTAFYPEFANALAAYAANRVGLVAKLQDCYKTVSMNFPKMDYDGQVRDVDPFTVFGLFNKGISNGNRIKLLTAIKEGFGIKAAVPERFDGIPVLNNMMSCFFAYSNDPRRGENDIQNLWHMYDVAIAVADGDGKRKNEFVDVWNTAIAQYGVKWNLTIGLYWIRPEFFINLDSVNRDYINKDLALANAINAVAPKVLSGRVMPTGAQYMSICEMVLEAISKKKVGSMSLPELSYNAWKTSQSALPSAFTSYGIDPDTLNRFEGETSGCSERRRYSKEDFLSEVFMSSDEYDRIARLLEVKKNIVFQGAPGVGKTYADKRFAASLVGFSDSPKTAFVQFHQNYSYEDFIGGYKPDGNGFKYVEGVFYKFCQQAKIDSQSKYMFIIDEINRGNLSKIFGELLMLIEADKRNEYIINLAYTREPFSVPDNVYIIGMMNTADRSLAMIDYALRRRFSFISMKPQFSDEKFKALLAKNHDPKIGALVSAVMQLNEAIRSDAGLGEGFEIGHSYFCSNMAAADIVEFELKPLLKEYWYDDSDKVEEWIRNLDNAVK